MTPPDDAPAEFQPLGATLSQNPAHEQGLGRGVLSSGARFGNLQRPEFPAAVCPWHRAKGNMALPAPTSPGHQT